MDPLHVTADWSQAEPLVGIIDFGYRCLLWVPVGRWFLFRLDIAFGRVHFWNMTRYKYYAVYLMNLNGFDEYVVDQ